MWEENKILSKEQTNQVSRSNFSRHERKLLYVEPPETQQDNKLTENKTRSKGTMDRGRILFKTVLTAFSYQLVLVFSVQKANHSSLSIKENTIFY